MENFEHCFEFSAGGSLSAERSGHQTKRIGSEKIKLATNNKITVLKMYVLDKMMHTCSVTTLKTISIAFTRVVNAVT